MAMNNDVTVVLKDLPTTIRGFVTPGSDDEPCIVINSRMSREQQRLTFLHEMGHIERGELDDPNYVEYGDAI